MDIFAGRPEATEGREAKEIKVYDLLDSLGIHYWRVDHEPISTMKEGLEIEETLNCLTCKNLFLCNRQQSRFYLLIMPGNKTLKSKELSQQIGSTRLNLAPENKMAEYLDISPGAVSVLGLMNDKEKHVQLLVDEDIFNADYIACHPCVNTSSLKIKLRDVFDTFLTSVHHDYQVVSLTTNQK